MSNIPPALEEEKRVLQFPSRPKDFLWYVENINTAMNMKRLDVLERMIQEDWYIHDDHKILLLQGINEKQKCISYVEEICQEIAQLKDPTDTEGIMCKILFGLQQNIIWHVQWLYILQQMQNKCQTLIKWFPPSVQTAVAQIITQ